VSTLLTGVWLIGVLVSWLVYTNRASTGVSSLCQTFPTLHCSSASS